MVVDSLSNYSKIDLIDRDLGIKVYKGHIVLYDKGDIEIYSETNQQVPQQNPLDIHYRLQQAYREMIKQTASQYQGSEIGQKIQLLQDHLWILWNVRENSQNGQMFDPPQVKQWIGDQLIDYQQLIDFKHGSKILAYKGLKEGQQKVGFGAEILFFCEENGNPAGDFVFREVLYREDGAVRNYRGFSQTRIYYDFD